MVGVSRFKTQGFITLQVLMSILFMQIIFLSAWPKMKAIFINWQARICLNQLQLDLTILRVRSIIEDKILYLTPLSFDHNWALGWRVSVDNQTLWQKKPYQFVKINIEWHGFEQKPPLKFYPDHLKNHVNGYFKVLGYRLWLNRIGYTRMTHDL
jgi:hypothetical protein